MDIVDLLVPGAVLPSLKAQSKKHLLPERRIFETLVERELLGSTGMGQGIAIPHGRIAGLARIVGLFARLETPIAYDAVDDQPVDLVFLLLAPEGAGAFGSQ